MSWFRSAWCRVNAVVVGVGSRWCIDVTHARVVSLSLSLSFVVVVVAANSQREGVHFMYKCVMGLKEYDGRGWYVT